MTNGIVLAVAMLVSSTGASPTLEIPRTIVVPTVLAFDLPDRPATSRDLRSRLLNEQSGAAWRRDPWQTAPATTPKRSSKATRIFVIAAGGFTGFMAGGMIGGAATSKQDDDGVGVLKGVMIGAPIGAVAGGILGYWLTK